MFYRGKHGSVHSGICAAQARPSEAGHLRGFLILAKKGRGSDCRKGKSQAHENALDAQGADTKRNFDYITGKKRGGAGGLPRPSVSSEKEAILSTSDSDWGA